jgi:hypothetical protein
MPRLNYGASVGNGEDVLDGIEGFVKDRSAFNSFRMFRKTASKYILIQIPDKVERARFAVSRVNRVNIGLPWLYTLTRNSPAIRLDHEVAGTIEGGGNSLDSGLLMYLVLVKEARHELVEAADFLVYLVLTVDGQVSGDGPRLSHLRGERIDRATN